MRTAPNAPYQPASTEGYGCGSRPTGKNFRVLDRHEYSRLASPPRQFGGQRRLLSSSLLAFIQGAVRSVWAVELLLILRRDSGRAWTAEELVRELRGSAALVDDNLKGFMASGLVQEVEPGRFVHRPASPALEALCDELETEYRRRPVTVVNAIVARTTNHVQNLADAFRFRDSDK